MKLSLRGILLRSAALISTCYTLAFTAYLALRTFRISCLSTIEPMDYPRNLLQDVFLAVVFCVQHSLHRQLKEELSPAVGRILCIFSSTTFLHLMHSYWCGGSEVYVLPSLSDEMILALHSLAWLWLSASLLLTDPAELFGFKQIWHEEAGLHAPIHYKSSGAQRVLAHYRHPLAVGPLILLFACKVMTSDRLLLAALALLYVLLRTDLDYTDYRYLRYVSYPTRRYTYQRVEIRSRATLTKEIRALCGYTDLSDGEEEDVVSRDHCCSPHCAKKGHRHLDTSDCSDAGYCSSPTFHNPNYMRIVTTAAPGVLQSTADEVVVEQSSSSSCSSRRVLSKK